MFDRVESWILFVLGCFSIVLSVFWWEENYIGWLFWSGVNPKKFSGPCARQLSTWTMKEAFLVLRYICISCAIIPCWCWCPCCAEHTGQDLRQLLDASKVHDFTWSQCLCGTRWYEKCACVYCCEQKFLYMCCFVASWCIPLVPLQEEIAKLREEAAARTRSLEAELDKTRSVFLTAVTTLC
jgi:hypothetical protein